jgi:hypothetical protein
MPQKHDLGHQKKLRAREKRSRTEEAVSTETMARDLVKRGLADPIILGPRKA